MKKVFYIVLFLAVVAFCIFAVIHWGFMGIVVFGCIYGLAANLIPDDTKIGEK